MRFPIPPSRQQTDANLTGSHGQADARDAQQRPGIGSDVVVLSIKPAAAASVTGREIPVVFSGYVLPADSLEDRAHAGN